MSSGKNIAILCDYHLNSNRIGGMDRFFKAFNKQLLLKGHKVCWFFSGGEIFDFYSNFTIDIANKASLEKKFLDFIKTGEKIDIVVTHFLTLCTPFYKRIKEIIQPYVIAVDHNPRPLQGFSLKKRIRNKIKGKLYSQYIDCFVGVSEYTRECILEDFGKSLAKKTLVVYNGIDTSIYPKRIRRNRGKFIVASHLRESKGIHDLIDAVNTLQGKVRENIQIDIFGEGPLEKFLQEKVEIYSLQQQFEFKGSIPTLPALFQNYSYLLQPTYMECFSLSILESLAANVPVITTSVGGNTEIVKDGVNGFVFTPKKINALSGILEDIMNGTRHIGNNVDGIVTKEFNLEKMVNGHLKLLPI
ncbi:glycosyltransferase family 4 protein [Salinimicrobium sp. TH3]|uniref:glycosyltransferase family 4 protein n=1 Tax=Salinimicrobium sp. TH3 TaxID=2997342 RepID=UPI0022768A7F|nr:glycosyltransferase family 4 protein [Salinimicrobium sp. TH3]MCY2687867.1 glycosyltransferase family 4 protein [Salinimicrobium sp. TH3]